MLPSRWRLQCAPSFCVLEGYLTSWATATASDAATHSSALGWGCDDALGVSVSPCVTPLSPTKSNNGYNKVCERKASSASVLGGAKK